MQKYNISELGPPDETPAKKQVTFIFILTRINLFKYIILQKISETRKMMLDFLCESGDCLPTDAVSLEIRKYFDVPVHQAESLDWWKENQQVR